MSKLESLYRRFCQAQERHAYLRDASLQSPVETSETIAVMQAAVEQLEAADAAYEAEAAKNPDAARRVVLLAELKDVQAAIARARKVPVPLTTIPPRLPADFDRTLLIARAKHNLANQTDTTARQAMKKYNSMLDTQERYARALAVWEASHSRYQVAQQQIEYGTARVAHLQAQLQALPPAPAKLTGARKLPPSRAELLALAPLIRQRYEYNPLDGQVFDTKFQRPVNTQYSKIRVNKIMLPMHVFIGLLANWKIDPHNGTRLRSQYPGAKNQWTQSLLYLETNSFKMRGLEIV